MQRLKSAGIDVQQASLRSQRGSGFVVRDKSKRTQSVVLRDSSKVRLGFGSPLLCLENSDALYEPAPGELTAASVQAENWE